MAKCEAHLTYHIRHADAVKSVGEACGWKYSAIDGDALLGDKPFCYLTAYDPNDESLLRRCRGMEKILDELGITKERTKIERIIYDTKTGVDEITADTPSLAGWGDKRDKV